LPVKVPWCISASAPFLKLRIGEADRESPTEVTAVAQFGLQHEESGGEGLGIPSSIKIVQPPKAAADNSANQPTDGLYQLIRIVFESGGWARFNHSFADTQVVEEAAFDWSAMAHLRDAWKPGVESGRRYYWSLWRKSGICPNPRMYEVEGSIWTREINIKNLELKHYLILGHDAYIEVIAKTWRWESVRSLLDY